jgi:CDGSH-type Zn-finger protein
MSDDTTSVAVSPRVTAAANGPYLVTGAPPLYRRHALHSEHGEPLAWQTTARLTTRDRYALCRCGQSSGKPFCDGTHARIGFEASDAVVDETYDQRAGELGGTGITVRDDRSICVHAGFCGSRVTNVWKQVAATDDSTVRAQVIAMVERCPSGALTYRVGADDIEPLLPAAIAAIDDGPLWVTGGVQVALADGTTIETRNRVTLCRCGASEHKPLCDGSHKAAQFRDPA